MVVFPNAKINIGLHITGKRADGFHNLETIFYPVEIKDVLEIIGDEASTKPGIKFTSSGNTVNGLLTDNLCFKAYSLIKQDHPSLPEIQLHLHKNIPAGAGLGGGSADAAFTLQLLNKLFSLNISAEKLSGYALALGSDCPFFLMNQPAFATGRGEELQKIPLDLSAFDILIVNPGIHVNTGWAFGQLSIGAFAHAPIKELIMKPMETWKENIANDFEIPVFKNYPEIAAIKNKLYESGAIYAAMSGSGSSVFGIFSKGKTNGLTFPAHYLRTLV